MLRESSTHTDNDIDLADVTGGLSGTTDIPQADLLVGLAEAIVARDAVATGDFRTKLLAALGNDAMVDAVATISGFHGFVRIADSIGIPYTTAAQGQDAPDVREAAGINAFHRIREGA